MIDQNTLTKIKDGVKGEVITPSDSNYDEMRTVFYGGIDSKPAVIVQVANASDVQHVVNIAREEKLELAIRSGGHSYAGYSSVDDGVVIDLRAMKKIDIDEKSQTAWVETGATTGELTQAVDAHDLAIGFGDTGSVGVGGITLGGGVGFLVRKFGLAIDNLPAAEVVTADGELLIADATHHPDLFWALRGGGGNFGVVTRFQFQLHSLKEAYGGLLFLPATPEVIAQVMSGAEKAPEELSIIFNVMPAPPMPFLPAELHGKLSIMAMVMYVGNATDAEKVLAPFRSVAQPLADMLKPMRYKEIFFPDDPSRHPLAVSKTMMMDHVDQALAKKILDQLDTLSDAPMRAVQLRPLGGKMATIAPEATAFAHRKSKIMVNIAAFYETAEQKSARSEWVEKTAELLRQEDTGAYIGFLGPGDEDRLTEAYPPQTLQKLQTVKRQYDPTNFFHHNLNIEPR